VSHSSWQFAHGVASLPRATFGGAVSPVRRLAVVPCLLLVACGSGGGNNAPVTTGTPEPSASITVFAAASLARVMPKEISAFAAVHPSITVAGDYEGTPALLTKLEADGSLADVFVSADLAHMTTAQSRGLVAAPQTLATNSLVIAVPLGNPAHLTGLADLARGGLKLSIADTSVPVGSYAEQAFKIAETNHDVPAGFARAALANVATRPTDVTTVVANVAAGVVDAGIVYSTDAKANTGISALPIAKRDQPATVYALAVTRQARAATAAQEFVAFLLSAQGQSLFHSAGFGGPTP
jgi:molybdate transport system substrate-binding protein